MEIFDVRLLGVSVESGQGNALAHTAHVYAHARNLRRGSGSLLRANLALLETSSAQDG